MMLFMSDVEWVFLITVRLFGKTKHKAEIVYELSGGS